MEARLLTLGRRPPSVTAAGDNMRQLVQLRWLAAIGQLVTVLIVHYRLAVPLPLGPMLGVVAALAAVNLLCMRLVRRREVGNLALLLSLAFDVGALTVQLYAAARDGDALRVTVVDRGEGFAPELLARLGKPIPSSKGPGHGVGLFLAANVARTLGGRLDVRNRERGAAVTLTLPLATIGATEAAERWIAR